MTTTDQATNEASWAELLEAARAACASLLEECRRMRSELNADDAVAVSSLALVKDLEDTATRVSRGIVERTFSGTPEELDHLRSHVDEAEQSIRALRGVLVG